MPGHIILKSQKVKDKGKKMKSAGRRKKGIQIRIKEKHQQQVNRRNDSKTSLSFV